MLLVDLPTCLQDHQQERGFSKACLAEVQRYQQESLRDIRLNHRLFRACKEDVGAVCAEACDMQAGEVCGGKVGGSDNTALNTADGSLHVCMCVCVHVVTGNMAACLPGLQVLACLSDKQEQLKSSACRKEVGRRINNRARCCSLYLSAACLLQTHCRHTSVCQDKQLQTWTSEPLVDSYLMATVLVGAVPAAHGCAGL